MKEKQMNFSASESASDFDSRIAAWFEQHGETYRKRIMELENQVELLHEELRMLKSKNEREEKTEEKKERDNFETDDEKKDRQERKRCVVIHGVPEPPLGCTSIQAEINDRAQALRIIDYLEVPVTPVCHFRMPMLRDQSNPKPRLLKIVLPNSTAQRILLSRRDRLQDYDTRVWMRPSLTKYERTISDDKPFYYNNKYRTRLPEKWRPQIRLQTPYRKEIPTNEFLRPNRPTYPYREFRRRTNRTLQTNSNINLATSETCISDYGQPPSHKLFQSN